MIFVRLLNLVINVRKKTTSNLKLNETEAFLILASILSCALRGVVFHFISPMKMVLVGKSASFIGKSRLQMGKRIIIGDYVTISAIGLIGVNLGDNVSIGDFSKLIVSSDFNNLGSGIALGSGVGIGEYSRIGGSGGVSIGNNTIIGQYFSCHPENHIYTDTDIAVKFQGTERREIVIGEGCWIGSKVTVLAGSIVGDNCVIAAGAVVNGIFPSKCVIGGVPAKIIKKL